MGRSEVLTSPEISPNNVPGTYTKFSKELRKCLGYAFEPHANRMSPVLIRVLEHVLMYDRRIELLEFDVRFVSREVRPYMSTPSSKRSYNDLPAVNPSVAPEPPKPRVVSDVYKCLIMEPARQSSLNSSRMFDRRLWLRPLVELPKLHPNEMWMLQITFPEFVKPPIEHINPLEI